MNMQYTIRSIPDEIDHAVRQRAKREAKSLNAIVLEALARGLDLDAKPAEHTDLDHLIGTWQEDPEFDLAIAEFERVDEDAWKVEDELGASAPPLHGRGLAVFGSLGAGPWGRGRRL